MHLHKSFGTNEVAQAIGTSNSTVNRLFRNALQRTVAEEIRRQRLMRVRHLLSDKSVKISDIAAICGGRHILRGTMSVRHNLNTGGKTKTGKNHCSHITGNVDRRGFPVGHG